MKLNWKIDWSMRWMIEDVVFEPGGRDHSSETGSYNVSKKLREKYSIVKRLITLLTILLELKGIMKKCLVPQE